jgi:hypothetical protein
MKNKGAGLESMQEDHGGGQDPRKVVVPVKMRRKRKKWRIS